MDYNATATIIAKALLGLILALGGIVAILKGVALYRDGVGLRRESTRVQVTGKISITTSSVGAILMMTACGWGWLATLTLPSYSRDDNAIRVSTHGSKDAAEIGMAGVEPAESKPSMSGLTAAHRSFPVNATVRVTNLENGRSVEVKINDRGPLEAGRVIDLSRKAAEALGIDTKANAHVAVRVLVEPVPVPSS